ncbi:MAG TPA: GAF domain-containing sensor histidine kinase [Gaiellaceae bacterium]|nr:GAF domain-containing sensor histidine kinase [Gaiellaceae bacterium]
MASDTRGLKLERLQQITDAALAHLQLDELLGAVLLRTRAALEVDTCAILLLDEERDELVARAAVGLEEEVEQGIRIPVGRGFAGTIAAERKPVVLPDVDHADVLNPILREKGIKTLLGVPLIVGGRILGVVHVGSLTPREFTPGEVEFLQFAADRVSLAIEHARLFEAESSARRRLEDVQAVTDVALAHLELEELLTELLARVREILGTDTAAILLLDEERPELVARAAVGLEEEVERGVRIPLRAGFAGRVAAERRAIVLPDLDQADLVNPLLREKGIKSMLGVPLLLRHESIGVLHVGSLAPRDFTAADIELLELVAERAALAIEKARVFDDVVRLDQLKMNFVAVASHELRTPASAVYGILATLRERGPSLPEETRRELEETLWEQAVRMTRLIEQLLDLSRLDEHAIVLDPQPVVLRALLDDVARTAVREDKLDAVRVDVEADVAAVVDRHVVERVVSNLLVNAVRYGEPPVVVSAEHRDRHVRIAVQDAGGGVPPELVPRLFDRFEQGFQSQGSGLGLAIAKAYARAHGGDLVYDPTGVGARFELILPRN